MIKKANLIISQRWKIKTLVFLALILIVMVFLLKFQFLPHMNNNHFFGQVSKVLTMEGKVDPTGFPQTPVNGSIIVDNKFYYIAVINKLPILIAYDLESQKEVWKKTLSNTPIPDGFGIDYSISLKENLLFIDGIFYEDGRVNYEIDKNGENLKLLLKRVSTIFPLDYRKDREYIQGDVDYYSTQSPGEFNYDGNHIYGKNIKTGVIVLDYLVPGSKIYPGVNSVFIAGIYNGGLYFVKEGSFSPNILYRISIP